MGEAKRRKKLDPTWGQPKETTNQVAKVAKIRESVPEKPKKTENEAKNIIEYVKQNTLLKGRGYLAYAQGKCIYYGKEDYLGDEDDILKAFVQKYNLDLNLSVSFSEGFSDGCHPEKS